MTFAPVSAVSAEIDQRSEQDLQPVSVSRLPLEIRPYAIAINRLLQRAADSMAI